MYTTARGESSQRHLNKAKASTRTTAPREYLPGWTASESPVQVVLFFMRRFEEVKKLLAGKKAIFPGVVRYWYRVEFQSRGAPHVHMLVWLQESIPESEIDQYVQARVPRGDDARSVPLRELVMRLQMHGCRDRCKKGQKPGGSPNHCCFGFPHAVNLRTHVKDGHARYTYRRDSEKDSLHCTLNEVEAQKVERHFASGHDAYC